MAIDPGLDAARLARGSERGSPVVITIDRTAAPAGVVLPLRAIVRRTLGRENASPGEIGIRLSDDAELRSLNRAWRGIDRATDVLSFPYEGERDQRVWGDLVISIERALEQARRYRVSPGRELARLVIHGTLHLVGHDHHRVAERVRMRRAEERAMREARADIRDLDRAWRRS